MFLLLVMGVAKDILFCEFGFFKVFLMRVESKVKRSIFSKINCPEDSSTTPGVKQK